MQITRENCVGDVAQKLQEIHPEHSIRIKNHLLKLTNEQKISNVMDKEDILTAFIQEMKEMEEEEEEEEEREEREDEGPVGENGGGEGQQEEVREQADQAE